MSATARQLTAPQRRSGRSAPQEPLRVTAPSRRAGEPARARKAEQRPALKVVPRQVRRRRAGVVLTLGVATLFALMLGLVAFQARIAQDQLRLDRVETELREAESQFARLRLEVARLESPDRIVAEAEALGLERPSPDQITYLAPSPAAAVEVLAAGGPLAERGPAGTGDVEEWSTLKPLLSGR
jgi:cell division protein FtsL